MLIGVLEMKQTSYPLPRTWPFTATRIALLTVMTLSIVTSLVADWLLFVYGTSYDATTPGATVFFLPMSQIAELLPPLIAMTIIGKCLALFAWGQTLCLRPVGRDLDHETVLNLVETVAGSKVSEIMDGAYDHITATMQVPRLIDQINREWPKLSLQVAEWAGLLAASVARDLNPLRLQLRELLLQCNSAMATESSVRAKLHELDVETGELSTQVARMMILRRENSETKAELEARLNRLQAQLAEIGQPGPTNVVTLTPSQSAG